jgi:hypothetical protein
LRGDARLTSEAILKKDKKRPSQGNLPALEASELRMRRDRLPSRGNCVRVFGPDHVVVVEIGSRFDIGWRFPAGVALRGRAWDSEAGRVGLAHVAAADGDLDR